MSISAGGIDSFKSIGELDEGDLIQFDTPSGATVSPGNNQQVEVDYPIQTEDNEVFVVTDARPAVRAIENVTGSLDTTTDSYWTNRYILTTDTADDLTSDEELGEKGLMAMKEVAYSTTVGHYLDRFYSIEPSIDNPRVMPFGSGEYSFIVPSDATRGNSQFKLRIQGYVLEVDDDTMTRYLRRLR